MYKIRILNRCLIVFGLWFFTACDGSRVFEDNMAIDNNEWNIKQVIKLEVPVSDNLSKNNLYINVRNGGSYSYSNLFLFITTTMPGGKKITDTLECMLADENGKWLGKGTGHLIDNRIPFKRNVIFPDTGRYIFEIEQAMRMEKLPEIYDIGLRIEKVKN
jgi:gliding motility-associated lipoprotein GldH